MSNIFTQSQSPAFKRQAIDEYFIQPMFMAEDIRGLITVRTDIKGTEILNRVARPSMLTKPKTAPGFTAAGSFALTTTDITVHPMAMEFEQNARAFWGSIVQQLLATGYKEDDVEQMKSPDVWNKVLLPLIAEAGQDDLIRQMFFANPIAETFTSGIPTGTLDTNYTGYTGFLSHFINDLISGTIPSAQHVSVASATSQVKQEAIHTYTAGTDTVLTITINGVAYAQAYRSSATVTCNDWIATHKAAIEARCGLNGVIVTNPSAAAIKIVSRIKGQSFTATSAVTGSGSVAVTGVVAAVKAGGLAANEADTTLESMLDAVTPEMHEFDLAFMVTATMWRNLIHTLKDRQTIMGDYVMKNGLKVPTYEGFPIIVRPDWDKWISVAQNGIKPHRALLTTAKNLLFATDGTSDSDMIETWYNQEAQMRRYRVQYKAETVYLHKELVVLAGFID